MNAHEGSKSKITENNILSYHTLGDILWDLRGQSFVKDFLDGQDHRLGSLGANHSPFLKSPLMYTSRVGQQWLEYQ